MRRFVRLLALVFAALLTSGCATVQLNLKVNPDGTGQQEMILAVDQSRLAFSGVDPLEPIRMQWAADGATVHDYATGQRIGIRGVKQLHSDQMQWDNGLWVGKLEFENSFFWYDYTLDVNVDLASDFEMLKLPRITDAVDIRASVELPTKVNKHNGQLDASGHKVTWTLTPGTTENLTLKARQYLVGRILFTAVLVLTFAGGILVLSQLRSKPKAPDGTDRDETMIKTGTQ